MKHDASKKQPQPLDPDAERLLVALARLPAGVAGSPPDATRLDRLVTDGYLVRDPKLQAATFRLTIRGWAVVRRVAPNTVAEEPAGEEDQNV